MITRLRAFTVLIAVILAVALAVAIGNLFAPIAHAAAAPGSCQLVVPNNPTSADGLTTPYRLAGCTESDPDQAAFVEATILDPATGALSIYHPLVVDGRDRPAHDPVPVTLPAHAVVGVWFGSNADALNLVGAGARSCVDGFGQFAYCNAPAFFAAANTAIHAGKITVPALGMAKDGKPCPTTRDFSVVDQDQSDNLVTGYWVSNGKMSQVALPDATALTNGSDEGLLAKFIDPALGCTPWKTTDQTTGTMMASLALNELSAAANQPAPAALVPTNDPMVTDGGTAKTNLYRAGVDQPNLPAGQTPTQYCNDLAGGGHARLMADASLFSGAPGPGGADLLSFLSTRYTASLTNLGCTAAQQQNQQHPFPRGPHPVQRFHHF